MGRTKNKYWLDQNGERLAQNCHDRISHAIANFVSCLTNHRRILQSEEAGAEVLQAMVEGRDDMTDYHYDNDKWH